MTTCTQKTLSLAKNIHFLAIFRQKMVFLFGDGGPETLAKWIQWHAGYRFVSPAPSQ